MFTKTKHTQQVTHNGRVWTFGEFDLVTWQAMWKAATAEIERAVLQNEDEAEAEAAEWRELLKLEAWSAIKNMPVLAPRYNSEMRLLARIVLGELEA